MVVKVCELYTSLSFLYHFEYFQWIKPKNPCIQRESNEQEGIMAINIL